MKMYPTRPCANQTECVLNSRRVKSWVRELLLLVAAYVRLLSLFALCCSFAKLLGTVSLLLFFSSIPPFMRSSPSLLALLVSTRSLSLLYDPIHLHLILPINLPPTDLPQHIYAYSAKVQLRCRLCVTTVPTTVVLVVETKPLCFLCHFEAFLA